MSEYPRPWRIAYRLSWWVVDSTGGIVAGPFGSHELAAGWMERNG